MKQFLPLTIATFLFLLCTAPESENDKARSRWAKASTGNYTFHFSYNCFCPTDFVGPFVVSVKNDRIDSMYNLTTKSTVADSEFTRFLTITQSFYWIDSVQGSSPKVHEVQYDDRLGYPKFANFDWEPVGADGAMGLYIDSVEIIKYG
jgi:hypothetical protein